MASWGLLGSGDHGMCVSRGFQHFDTPAGRTPGKWRVPSDIPTINVKGADFPVIPSHFASLLDPQLPLWTCCEYPIEHDTDLIIQWTEMERLINEQSARYPDAVRNACGRYGRAYP
eukprot:4552-Amphidinium_carterae.1